MIVANNCSGRFPQAAGAAGARTQYEVVRLRKDPHSTILLQGQALRSWQCQRQLAALMSLAYVAVGNESPRWSECPSESSLTFRGSLKGFKQGNNLRDKQDTQAITSSMFSILYGV
eukprot:764472-Hanusia_phi.AAC.6